MWDRRTSLSILINSRRCMSALELLLNFWRGIYRSRNKLNDFLIHNFIMICILSYGQIS